MKKIYFEFTLLILLAGAGLAAQSLENNEYYKKSVEYADLSQQALDAGTYDEATEYARLSQEYAARSRQYIEEMLLLIGPVRPMRRPKPGWIWPTGSICGAGPPMFMMRPRAILNPPRPGLTPGNTKTVSPTQKRWWNSSGTLKPAIRPPLPSPALHPPPRRRLLSRPRLQAG